MSLASVAVADEKPISPKLSMIKQDCESIGQQWKSIYGVKVDDLSEIDSIPSQDKIIIEKIRPQIQPLGITAMADFSCVVTNKSLNTVTVRVFVFENRVRALNWWKKKYGYDGWKQHYTKVENKKYFGVDSKQLKKRAIIYKNIWITAHHLKQGNEHLILLDNIISKLDQSSSH